MKYLVPVLLLLLSFANPAFAQCVNPSGERGQIVFNETYDVLQGCTARGWMAFHPPADATPDAFSFTDQTGTPTNSVISSNALTITGIDVAAAVSISGDGSPEFRINGGAWVTSGNIQDGQTLELRLTSNAADNTMNSATVMVGTVSDQWDVTTAAGGPGIFQDSFEVWSSGGDQPPNGWIASSWSTSDCGRSSSNVTDGTFSVVLHTGGFLPSWTCRISQDFDLSSYSTLILDVTYIYGAPDAGIQIDGVTVESTISTENDLTVDISSYSGLHTITLGHINFDNDASVAYDNFRLLP